MNEGYLENMLLLCDQTITIYNIYQDTRTSPLIYRRTVIHNGAFFDSRQNNIISNTGITPSVPFNVIIPQGADGKIYVPPLDYHDIPNVDITNQYTFNVQDRIILGEIDREFVPNDPTWASFQADNMVTVRTIDEKYLNAEIVHVEVGG